MSLEREAMKGRLASLKDKKKSLVLKGEGLCTAIRQQLNTALTPFTEDMEIPQVAQQMDDLTLTWAELVKVSGNIERLERELR